jgi:DNA modification methylase
MSAENFRLFLTDCFKNMIEYTKKGAGVYVFHNHKEQKAFEDTLKEAGYEIKQQIIWNKPSL